VHRLERQVQNQKTLIESVVDIAQVAIVLLDEQEHVLLDNQEYKKLVNDLGKEPAAILLAELRAKMGNTFDEAYGQHLNIAAREICVTQPNQVTRWFSCAVSWFEEQDVGADAFYEPLRRHYLLLTIQDISELKKQQEALRINTLHALLSEQERIQGLRETLAGAVYQLEGPLNMLSAVANMMERRGDTGIELPAASALEEAMSKSREALDTLRACIPDHSDEMMQTVNLNEVLSDVLKLTTPNMLGAGIVVEWLPAQGIAAISGQAAQLVSLFKQLVANAIEAVNEQRGGKRELRITCRPLVDHMEVFIEDSGPGIAHELRYKIFQPFFTTKGAARQHLGLGLAMAQDIATRHGGTIDIDPEYHHGCRVRVQLPRVAGDHHE
jgi:protein-histidine pros-kinase